MEASTRTAISPEPASVALSRPIFFDLLAVGVTILFFAHAWAYWVPAHGGVDQNGYFAGARIRRTLASDLFRPARRRRNDPLLRSRLGVLGSGSWRRRPERLFGR